MRSGAPGSPLLHVSVDDGVGPTVLLIHGVASSSITFQNLLPLIKPDHRCIAIDLLGFGESPSPAGCEYTLADHVAAVERTIRSLHLSAPFTMVGHSMGSLIGARYAARNKKSVQKLVLVSPPIYVAPEELANRVDREVMGFYMRAYKYVRENKEFTLRNARAVEAFMPIRKAMDINEENWDAFVKSLEHSIESQTTVSDIAAVRCPIEVFYGSLDEFHSDGVLKIISRMTGVNVHRVVGSDHLIDRRLARVAAKAID